MPKLVTFPSNRGHFEAIARTRRTRQVAWYKHEIDLDALGSYLGSGTTYHKRRDTQGAKMSQNISNLFPQAPCRFILDDQGNFLLEPLSSSSYNKDDHDHFP